MLHTGTGRKEPDFNKIDIGLVAVGPGWSDLVRKVYAAVDLLRGTGTVVKILQVKEKFGALRVYVDAPDTAPGRKELYDVLWAIETESATVCDICGKPGYSMTNGHSVRTMCAEHQRPNDARWDYGQRV